jgi:hypothetical protein
MSNRLGAVREDLLAPLGVVRRFLEPEGLQAGCHGDVESPAGQDIDPCVVRRAESRVADREDRAGRSEAEGLGEFGDCRQHHGRLRSRTEHVEMVRLEPESGEVETVGEASV